MARPPRFDDDEILDRAMVELWRHGWANTSIRDLEQVLELKAPSIYRRFGSKAGLGAAVVNHYVDRVVRRRIEKYLPGSGDPIENIQAFLECAVMPAETGDELWGCVITTIAVDTGGPSDGETAPDLTAALRRGLALIEGGLRGEVERAALEGRLAATVDVDSATSTIALVMQGLMAQARAGVPSPELRQRGPGRRPAHQRLIRQRPLLAAPEPRIRRARLPPERHDDAGRALVRPAPPTQRPAMASHPLDPATADWPELGHT